VGVTLGGASCAGHFFGNHFNGVTIIDFEKTSNFIASLNVNTFKQQLACVYASVCRYVDSERVVIVKTLCPLTKL